MGRINLVIFGLCCFFGGNFFWNSGRVAVEKSIERKCQYGLTSYLWFIRVRKNEIIVQIWITRKRSGKWIKFVRECFRNCIFFWIVQMRYELCILFTSDKLMWNCDNSNVSVYRVWNYCFCANNNDIQDNNDVCAKGKPPFYECAIDHNNAKMSVNKLCDKLHPTFIANAYDRTDSAKLDIRFWNMHSFCSLRMRTSHFKIEIFDLNTKRTLHNTKMNHLCIILYQNCNIMDKNAINSVQKFVDIQNFQDDFSIYFFY